MWVGVLLGELSTRAVVWTEVEAVARMLAELERSSSANTTPHAVAIDEPMGEGCSPSSRWQGVAAAKFSGLPGLTAGGSSTYVPT